jgi:hypothetical protein
VALADLGQAELSDITYSKVCARLRCNKSFRTAVSYQLYCCRECQRKSVMHSVKRRRHERYHFLRALGAASREASECCKTKNKYEAAIKSLSDRRQLG